MWADMVETTPSSPSLAQSRSRRGEPLEPATAQRPRTVAAADQFSPTNDQQREAEKTSAMHAEAVAHSGEFTQSAAGELVSGGLSSVESQAQEVAVAVALGD